MMNKKGAIAIGQIILLIIGIIAVSYALGSQIELIDAPALPATPDPLPPPLWDRLTGWILSDTGPLNALANTAVWAAIGYAVGYILGKALTGWHGGTSGTRLAEGLGAGLGIGTATWYFTSYLATQFAQMSFVTAIGWIPIVGQIAAIAAGIFAAFKAWNAFTKKIGVKTVTLQCKYWQPERGGENCEECNDQLLPCTEYQCKSLGGACKLINRQTENPICVYDNAYDLKAPIITPLESSLKDGYKYEPLTSENGVEIKYKQQDCLPEFTPFTFGVSLDKYGYCKMDDHITSNFSSMKYDFAGINYPILEAEQWLKFPGTAFYQKMGIEISNGGDYEYYIRCENTNGVASSQFLFKFCVNKGPDTTGPLIIRTTPVDRTPIRAFNETEKHEIPVSVYTNEPANCKWSHSSLAYSEMENNMSCSLNGAYFNADLNYPCSGILTGLENNKENKFYFNCNDSSGNIGLQKTLTLLGTRPLVISSVEPNNTIVKGSSDSIRVPLKVQTSAGARNGEALCSYSLTGVYNEYIPFEQSGGSAMHSTNLWLDSGEITVYIQCFDQGANIAQTSIQFEVEKDTYAPVIVRVLKESTDLKIITDEKAECVYNTQPDIGCSYNSEDGSPMTTYDNLNHITPWDSSKTYYIKCSDDFGNQPIFDQCSMVAKPFKF